MKSRCLIRCGIEVVTANHSGGSLFLGEYLQNSQ